MKNIKGDKVSAKPIMIRTIISFASVIILSTSFSALAKTKVTWSMESNADRDPIMIEK